MLTRFCSAVSKSRLRQRELDRRRALHRPLRPEPLEGRLLLAGDSWVVATDIPSQTSGYFPVAADDAGSVYVGATRRDGSATSPDMCLTKYSSDGQLVWMHDLRFSGYQYVTDVAVGNDGVYIVGGFEGTMNLDPAGGAGGLLQSRGGHDGYLAKYDADGAFLWAHQWGGVGGDKLQGIAVSEEGVFVTGATEISVRNKLESHQLVASLSSAGLPRWEKTMAPIWGYPTAIAVFKPMLESTCVYISATGETGGYVEKLTENADGKDAVPSWTYDLGANISMAGWGGIAVGTVDNGGNPLPSLYVLTQGAGAGNALLKISDDGDIGRLVWSRYMDAYPWGVSVEGTTAYVAGYFTEQADFDGALLTSRGSNDGFLARYNTDDGRLLAAQRMGGSTFDGWYSVAVGNGCVYAGGRSTSTDGDFPAGGPGEMSAFVAGDPQGEVFVMQLDTAAPLVHVAATDISVAPDTPVTLSATTSAGTIKWYESGQVLGTGNDLLVTLGLGAHEISAIATDELGSVGMAGVVVNVTLPTKFYVVDDATANQTFEYSAAGALNECYSLNAGNTAPRGAASTAAGDTTWVVDANRKVYVYNASGESLRSWIAGTLNSKSVVEGIATNGTDVWIVDAKTDKVYRYANGASFPSGTLTAAGSFSLNTSNLSPKDVVTDGTYLWVVNDSTTDTVFKYTLSGTFVSSWTISGGGGSPTGITLDPSGASQDLWIVDSGSDKVYQYVNGRAYTSGPQTAATTFVLAAGNTNPQGIADPPVPTSELSHVRVVAGQNVDPSDIVVTSDASPVTTVPLASFPATRASVLQRTTAVSRGVDEVMSRWDRVAEPIRPVTTVAHTAYSIARRPAHIVDVDLLGGELDATLGLMADNLAAASR